MVKVIIDFVSSISACNHTRDKQIGLPLCDRPILLSLGYLDAIRIYVISVILPKESNRYIPKRLRRSMHMKCGDVNLQQQLVYNYGLLTKCEVKMAGYWPSSFSACLWTETESRSINTQENKEANILPFYPTIYYMAFKNIFFCGTRWVVSSGKDTCFLPARVANHNVGLDSSRPLTELAI